MSREWGELARLLFFPLYSAELNSRLSAPQSGAGGAGRRRGCLAPPSLRSSVRPSPRHTTCCMPYIDEPGTGARRSVRGIFAEEPQAVFNARCPPPTHTRTVLIYLSRYTIPALRSTCVVVTRPLRPMSPFPSVSKRDAHALVLRHAPIYSITQHNTHARAYTDAQQTHSAGNKLAF